MKITVLIAAAAAGDPVAMALGSVAVQSHTEWEVLVGGPETASEAESAVRRFAVGRPGVEFFRFQGVTSAAATYSRLLGKATGDAVAFLDPCDVWLPRHLAIAVQQLSSDADVIVADARLYDSGQFIAEVPVPKQVATSPLKTLFARDVIPAKSCVVVRRSIALRAGPFDEQFASGGIRDFLLRLAAVGARFSATHRSTCRHSRTTLLPGARALREAQESCQFYEKHRDFAAIPSALRRRLLAGSLVNQGRLLRASDPAGAALCFRRAWALQPVHVQALGQYALTEWRLSGPSD